MFRVCIRLPKRIWNFFATRYYAYTCVGEPAKHLCGFVSRTRKPHFSRVLRRFYLFSLVSKFRPRHRLCSNLNPQQDANLWVEPSTRMWLRVCGLRVSQYMYMLSGVVEKINRANALWVRQNFKHILYNFKICRCKEVMPWQCRG